MTREAERCDLLCLDLEMAERIRGFLKPPDQLRSAAERAHALADATRLLVASALSQADELCVCDLAWVCGRSQNLISHHLRALRHAGLVTSRRDKKMVMYALTENGSGLLSAVLAGTREASV